MLKRTLCCGHTPRLRLMELSSERISLPMIYAVPEVGGKSPVRIDLKQWNQIGGLDIVTKKIKFNSSSHYSNPYDPSEIILTWNSDTFHERFLNEYKVKCELTWWWFFQLHCDLEKKLFAPHRSQVSIHQLLSFCHDCKPSQDYQCKLPIQGEWVPLQCRRLLKTIQNTINQFDLRLYLMNKFKTQSTGTENRICH